MKFIIPATTLLYASVQAEDTTEAPEEIGGRKFNSIVGMAHSQITTSFSKTEFGDKINKYGCHCFPGGTKAAGGVGPAVDALDSLCKKLYKCHKCIQIEFGVDAVDVNDGRYTWALNDDGTLNCDKNQNNPARKALCQCDREYAYEMKNVWTDDGFNEYYWLSNRNARQGGTFDYDATCVANNNGSGAAADQCCGSAFPNKEPFDSTQRACCNSDSVYNIFTQECCTDGTVAGIGSC